MRRLFFQFALTVLAVAFAVMPVSDARGQVIYSDFKTYVIDQSNSEITFFATHLNVSRVKGWVREFAGEVQFDPDNISGTKIDLRMEAKSIDTGLFRRDAHLRSVNFLDASNYPDIVFQSNRVVKNSDGYYLVGVLTIRGVSKRVMIPCLIIGPVRGPSGQSMIGISGEVTVNRLDFGILWSPSLDSGGYLVSNDIDIVFGIEAVRE